MCPANKPRIKVSLEAELPCDYEFSSSELYLAYMLIARRITSRCDHEKSCKFKFKIQIQKSLFHFEGVAVTENYKFATLENRVVNS